MLIRCVFGACFLSVLDLVFVSVATEGYAADSRRLALFVYLLLPKILGLRRELY